MTTAVAEKPSTYLLSREMEAARVLKEQLAAVAGDDEDAIRDTIEGETNLHEIIRKVVEEISAATANIEGIKAHVEKLRARQDRLEAGIEIKRTAILNAMAIGEIRKLDAGIATLSRKPVPPKLVVVDEASIPSEFWKRADPTLDKKALTSALKNEEKVPGAQLSNGGETLALRWS